MDATLKVIRRLMQDYNAPRHLEEDLKQDAAIIILACKSQNTLINRRILFKRLADRMGHYLHIHRYGVDRKRTRITFVSAEHRREGRSELYINHLSIDLEKLIGRRAKKILWDKYVLGMTFRELAVKRKVSVKCIEHKVYKIISIVRERYPKLQKWPHTQ